METVHSIRNPWTVVAHSGSDSNRSPVVGTFVDVLTRMGVEVMLRESVISVALYRFDAVRILLASTRSVSAYGVGSASRPWEGVAEEEAEKGL